MSCKVPPNESSYMTRVPFKRKRNYKRLAHSTVDSFHQLAAAADHLMIHRQPLEPKQYNPETQNISTSRQEVTGHRGHHSKVATCMSPDRASPECIGPSAMQCGLPGVTGCATALTTTKCPARVTKMMLVSSSPQRSPHSQRSQRSQRSQLHPRNCQVTSTAGHALRPAPSSWPACCCPWCPGQCWAQVQGCHRG